MLAPRPTPSAPANATASELTARETWGDKVYAALPLFIVGLGFLAVTFDLYFSGDAASVGRGGGIRLQPWALFLALSVTGLAAGTFALLIEDEDATVAAPALAPVTEAPSAPVPEWDESTLEPEEPTFVRPRTWEQYPDIPEGSTSASEPRDAVLDQIDEIRASLRRKTTPQRPD